MASSSNREGGEGELRVETRKCESLSFGETSPSAIEGLVQESRLIISSKPANPLSLSRIFGGSDDEVVHLGSELSDVQLRDALAEQL